MYRILKCQNCGRELAQVKDRIIPVNVKKNSIKKLVQMPIWNENNSSVFKNRSELVVECRKCKSRYKVLSDCEEFDIELT